MIIIITVFSHFKYPITMNDFDNGEVLGENIDSGKNASERKIISEIYGKFALSRTNWLLGLLDPFDGI